MEKLKRIGSTFRTKHRKKALFGGKLKHTLSAPLGSWKEQVSVITTDGKQCSVPRIVRVIVEYMKEHALEEPGLFRLAGSGSDADNLQTRFESDQPIQLSLYDVHTIAEVLKRYVRDMFPPLMPFLFYEVALKILENDLLASAASMKAASGASGGSAALGATSLSSSGPAVSGSSSLNNTATTDVNKTEDNVSEATAPVENLSELTLSSPAGSMSGSMSSSSSSSSSTSVSASNTPLTANSTTPSPTLAPLTLPPSSATSPSSSSSSSSSSTCNYLPYIELLTNLPIVNRDLLYYLLRFLSIVAQHAEVNHMNSQNLGIIFGPNILQADPQSALAHNPQQLMLDGKRTVIIVQRMIDMVGNDADFVSTSDRLRGESVRPSSNTVAAASSSSSSSSLSSSSSISRSLTAVSSTSSQLSSVSSTSSVTSTASNPSNPSNSTSSRPASSSVHRRAGSYNPDVRGSAPSASAGLLSDSEVSHGSVGHHHDDDSEKDDDDDDDVTPASERTLVRAVSEQETNSQPKRKKDKNSNNANTNPHKPLTISTMGLSKGSLAETGPNFVRSASTSPSNSPPASPRGFFAKFAKSFTAKHLDTSGPSAHGGGSTPGSVPHAHAHSLVEESSSSSTSSLSSLFRSRSPSSARAHPHSIISLESPLRDRPLSTIGETPQSTKQNLSSKFVAM